jgi:hypothetical protein
VKPTWVFTLPPGEKARMLSRRAPEFPRSSAEKADLGPLKAYVANMPKTFRFSWLNYNGRSYLGPVRNQGTCGACYAFSACAAAESIFNLAAGLYDDRCIDFSEQFLAFCVSEQAPYSAHFSGCDGADYDYYELDALTQEGLCLEQDAPYDPYGAGVCPWDTQRVVFKNWYRIPCGDITAIKAAILYFGAVDAALKVTPAFEAYDQGVYEDTNTSCPDCAYSETTHVAALVGWDDFPPEGGGGCWILRNSWGPDWGEGGYMRIRYRSAAVACSAAYLTMGPLTPDKPAVTTGASADVQPTSAVLAGSVRPNGAETTCVFEYGSSTAYGHYSVPVVVSGSYAPESVTTEIAGLDSYATCHYRLTASNQLGYTTGEDRAFQTLPDHPLLPSVSSAAARDISWDFATVDGSVTAFAYPTTCHFEYGPDTAYGSIASPLDTGGQPFVASGMDPAPVTFTLRDLAPGTTYHFRLAADNAAGTAYSPDRTFATLDSGVLSEDFEHSGLIPDGWTQEQVYGDLNWQMRSGGVDIPAQAFSGEYNAFLFDNWYHGYTTRLVTPPIDVSQLQNPMLQFRFAMAEWAGDIDALTVCYRTSPFSMWIQLRNFTDPVSDWTRIQIPLPAAGTPIYLAFQGSPAYGRGICIDDVYVGEAPPPPAPIVLTRLPQGGDYTEEAPLDLTVEATGGEGLLSYQWYVDDLPITGATSATYHVESLTVADTGMYSCHVTDEAEQESQTPAVKITVYAAGMLPVAGPLALAALFLALTAVATRRRR